MNEISISCKSKSGSRRRKRRRKNRPFIAQYRAVVDVVVVVFTGEQMMGKLGSTGCRVFRKKNVICFHETCRVFGGKQYIDVRHS